MASNDYELVDCIVRSKESPDTFEVPSEEELSSLAIDSIVKLIFQRPVTNGSRIRGERMWVRVTRIEGKYMEGVLENDPVVIDELKYGDTIIFEQRNIAGIMPDDESDELMS